MSTKTIPQILPDDTARTRLTDRLTSHLAGDKSQVNMTAIEQAVLRMVAERGNAVGTELNVFYSEEWMYRGWPQKAWDSPRKRAGELLDAGLLAEAGTRRGTAGSLETLLVLSDAGRRTLGMFQ
jgi:hypothetical protein